MKSIHSEANVFEDLVKREILPLEVARKAAQDEEAYEILDRLLIENNRELCFVTIGRSHLDRCSYFLCYSSYCYYSKRRRKVRRPNARFLQYLLLFKKKANRTKGAVVCCNNEPVQRISGSRFISPMCPNPHRSKSVLYHSFY